MAALHGLGISDAQWESALRLKGNEEAAAAYLLDRELLL